MLRTAKEKRIEKIELFRFRSILEQKSDGVNAGQSYDAKDDSADDGELASKKRADQIIAEKSDQTPVQCTDDDQNQNDISHITTPFYWYSFLNMKRLCGWSREICR